MFTREEYENLINNSPLFEIDKESSPAFYVTEERKQINLIVDYYSHYIYPNKDMSDYDLPLIQTAKVCIEGYNKKNGAFLNYFNYCLATYSCRYSSLKKVSSLISGLLLTKLISSLICLSSSLDNLTPCLFSSIDSMPFSVL